MDQLRAIRVRTQQWVVFGDSAFALDTHVQRMLKGVRARIPRGKAFNSVMASTRVANEHAFSELLSQWGLVGHKLVLSTGSPLIQKSSSCEPTMSDTEKRHHNHITSQHESGHVPR